MIDTKVFSFKGSTFECFLDAKTNCYHISLLECNGEILNIPSSIDGVVISTVSGNYVNGYSSIRLSDDNRAFKVIDDVLFSSDGTVMYLYPPQRKEVCYVVPEGVNTIFEGAIINDYLGELVFLNGVNRINQYAVYGTHLNKVTFPNSLKVIEVSAFKGNTGISDVIFDGTLEQWLDVEIGEENESILDSNIRLSKAGNSLSKAKYCSNTLSDSFIRDVLVRSVCLECVSCRCGLETYHSVGRLYDQSPCNEIPISLSWLDNAGVMPDVKRCNEISDELVEFLNMHHYYDELTTFETALLSKNIQNNANCSISNYEFHYAVEVLLWSVGLIGKLKYFEDYEVYDYRELLGLFKEHSLHSVIERCTVRDIKTIADEMKRAEDLWMGVSSSSQDLVSIEETFGEAFARRLFNSLGANRQGYKYRWYNVKKHARTRYWAFQWLFGILDWSQIGPGS